MLHFSNARSSNFREDLCFFSAKNSVYIYEKFHLRFIMI